LDRISPAGWKSQPRRVNKKIKKTKVKKMELSNEFIEDLFFRQMKEVTLRSNKQLRSFDAQFSGIRLRR